ncbi:MAG: hypothetical protein KDB90_11005 [Planctomycetes bacterium]|nr:hypothetical protein [Planctomycetota bacterium]
MRRMIGAAVGMLAMLTGFSSSVVADVPVPHQRGNQRFELEWKTPPTTYLNYKVASQAKVDPLEPLPAGAIDSEPSLSYAHFMGHEFDDTGTLHDIHAPFVMEDVLIQLGMQIPEKKKCTAGFNWDRKWKLPRLYDMPGLELVSVYTIDGSDRCGDADCVQISGFHDFILPDKEPADGAARWFGFHAETTAWFNVEQGRLQASDVVIHAARWRAKATKVAAARIDYHWSVRFEFSEDFDSTAGRYLNDKVVTAISKGAERVKLMQNGDSAWPYGSRARGGTALALLTLLTCDVPADDPAVIRGFEAMKGMEFEETYSVALSLMAYEARYITDVERRAYLSEGDDKFPDFKRELSDEDRKAMQSLVDWLVANQNQTKNPFWNYNIAPDTSRFDFSNTQYALLGLASALRCEIKIPTGVVGKLVEEVVTFQQPDGPKVKRVVGYKPPKGNSRKDDGRSTYAGKPTEARGWAYATKAKWDRYAETTDSYGSMTTAGLTCLLVGLDIVDQMDAAQLKEEFGSQQAYEKWKKAATESLEDGMCWLEYWFTITRNPNHGRTWYLYYMYGLERVMMLGQVRRLGVHDWYSEGASVLVTTQNSDGSWGTMPDTCFALLFLKKGTIPSRRPVTSEK